MQCEWKETTASIYFMKIKQQTLRVLPYSFTILIMMMYMKMMLRCKIVDGERLEKFSGIHISFSEYNIDGGKNI